jgi:hypothetical protein
MVAFDTKLAAPPSGLVSLKFCRIAYFWDLKPDNQPLDFVRVGSLPR